MNREIDQKLLSAIILVIASVTIFGINFNNFNQSNQEAAVNSVSNRKEDIFEGTIEWWHEHALDNHSKDTYYLVSDNKKTKHIIDLSEGQDDKKLQFFNGKKVLIRGNRLGDKIILPNTKEDHLKIYSKPKNKRADRVFDSSINLAQVAGVIGLKVNVSNGSPGTITGDGITCSYEGGSRTYGDCYEYYSSARQVTLQARNANSQYYADGIEWTGCDSMTDWGECVVNVSGSKSVTVLFKPLLYVSNNVEDGGRIISSDGRIDCQSNHFAFECGYTLSYGSTVTLNSTPNPGLAFEGWSGDCTGTGPCTVTVNKDTMVTANWSGVIKRKLAVIIFQFPGNPYPFSKETVKQQIFGISGNTLRNYYSEGTYGKINVTGNVSEGGEVFGPYDLNTTSQCEIGLWMNQAMARMEEEANLSDYDFTMILGVPVPTGTQCSFVGGALPGGRLSWNLRTDILGPHLGTSEHELGHNFDLGHSNSRACRDSEGNGVIFSDNCITYDYGDWYDVMGSVSNPRTFNTFNKSRLGAFSIPNIFEIRTSGIYTVEPLDIPGNGIKSLKIPFPFLSQKNNVIFERGSYMVEYRQPYGIFSSYSISEIDGIFVRAGSVLFTGGPIRIGESFHDPNSNITITPLSISPTGAVVDVRLGSDTCIRANPGIAVTPQNQFGHPGEARSYILTLTNNDSTACGSSEFRVNTVVPEGWRVVSPKFSLVQTIEPKANISIAISVTPSAIADGSYDIRPTVTNLAQPSYSASATATYTLSNTTDKTVNVGIVSGVGTITSNPAGIDCPGDCSEMFPEGATVYLTAHPAEGFYFNSGWRDDCVSQGVNPCVINIDSDKNIGIKFTGILLKVYNNRTIVTSDPPGIDCNSLTAYCEYEFADGSQVTITATPEQNNVFSSWGEACSGNPVTSSTCTVTMTGPVIVSATSILGVPVTVTPSGNGSGVVTSSPAGINCGSDCMGLYPSGSNTTVILTATRASDSVFAGWGGDAGFCGTSLTCAFSLNFVTSMNISATFNLSSGPSSYSLTINKTGTGGGSVSSIPAGTSCGASCLSFPANTSVTLTATADSGSIFAGWSGVCAGTGSCVVNMNAAKSVTAIFNTTAPPPASYSLVVTKTGTGSDIGTVTSSPAGINCGSDCIESYTSGTSVILTASPANKFRRWTGACSGTSPTCVVSMTAMKSAFAEFRK